MLSTVLFCVLSFNSIEWIDKKTEEDVWLKVFVSFPTDYSEETPLILFLGGGMGTPVISILGPMQPYIKDYIFVAPEQRGVWSINNTIPSYSLQEHAKDHANILDFATKRFKRKAYVWGISFGGVYALHLSDLCSDQINALIVTGPIWMNITKLNSDEKFKHAVESYANTTGKRQTCDEILERIPWFLYPLKWLGCPDENSGYWFGIFYFTQFAAKLGLTTKCEVLKPFCVPDVTPDAWSLISSPLVGWSDTIRLAWSNANYHIMNNIPVKDIVWNKYTLKNEINVIASKKDKLVPPFVLQDFYDGIQSPNKKIIWLENAGHMMFADSQEEHFKAFSFFLQSSCDAK